MQKPRCAAGIYSMITAVACLAFVVADTKAEKPNSLPEPKSTKKGVGLAESHGLGEKQLESLRVHWYYNWNSETKLTTPAVFVPMIFSLKRLESTISGDYVMGFNEPDHEMQSNIAVKDALQNWPAVAAKAKHVGSPSMASNPITGEWFPTFLKAKPKVDFVTVHWYKGVDSKRFIKDLEAIHAAYDKPIWVTEFAPQTAAGSKQEPHKYKQAQVDHFITVVVEWMEKSPHIHRYAWHDSKAGTSALFDDKGDLTPTGKAYAGAHHPPIK